MNILQDEITRLQRELYERCEALAFSLKIDDRIICDNFSISAINRPTSKETWRIVKIPEVIVYDKRRIFSNAFFTIQACDGASMFMSYSSFIWNLYNGEITL